MTETKQTKTKKPTFSKDQFLNARNPIGNLDALNIVLKDGKEYTIDEAEKELKRFLNRGVK